MAQITVKFERDADAVWFWELCKKLGTEVLEVNFGSDGAGVLLGADADCKGCTACDLQQSGCPAIQENRRSAEERKPNGKQKSGEPRRYVKIYT